MFNKKGWPEISNSNAQNCSSNKVLNREFDTKIYLDRFINRQPIQEKWKADKFFLIYLLSDKKLPSEKQ